jgi:hypothetical protein
MDVDLNTLGNDSRLNISFNDDIGIKDISFEGNRSESSASNLPTGFGPGIELLINDRKRNGFQAQASTSNDLGDLGTFDAQMDSMSGGNWSNTSKEPSAATSDQTSASTTKSGGLFGGLFSGWGNSSNNIKSTADVDKATAPDPTSYVRTAPKTWDGFAKTNDLPSTKPLYDSKQLSEREKRVKKRNMIDELDRWYEKGYLKENLRFNRDTPYEEVEEEYDAVLEKIRRKKSINLQKDILFNVMNFIEFSNSWLDPFGLKLEGLADKTTEELDSYEDIFGELYDKWKGGKMPPELALLCKVGFSIAMLHMSNNVLSSTPVAFQDVVKQSPELQRAWHESVVKTMSEASDNDGLSFITDILSNKMADDEKPSRAYSAPPAAIDPRTMEPVGKKPTPSIPSAGKGMNFTPSASTRPDISAARGGFPSTLFRESGVDINNQFSSVNEEPPAPKRAEMRGPRTNINELLNGLKPLAPSGNQTLRNEVSMNPMESFPVRNPGFGMTPSNQENMVEVTDVLSDSGIGMHESVISMEDAGQLQGVSKRRRRKPRSERSEIDIDLGITDI